MNDANDVIPRLKRMADRFRTEAEKPESSWYGHDAYMLEIAIREIEELREEKSIHMNREALKALSQDRVPSPRRILAFKLNHQATVTMVTAAITRVLEAGFFDGDMFVLAEVEDYGVDRDHIFHCIPTEHARVPEGGEYVGTVRDESLFAWHVFHRRGES